MAWEKTKIMVPSAFGAPVILKVVVVEVSVVPVSFTKSNDEPGVETVTVSSTAPLVADTFLPVKEPRATMPRPAEVMTEDDVLA